MKKVNNLKKKAAILRSILERYAQEDRDAAMVLRFMTSLFEEIDRGEVVPPMENKYAWHFFNTNSPLVEYVDLVEAAAEYASALKSSE